METNTHTPADIRYASVEKYSSVAGTVEIVSNAWSFLILRECFFGVRRFNQFQLILKVPRATLISRLNNFIALGVLRKEVITEGGRSQEYRLTDKGRDLYATMIALMIFGDRWLAGGEPPPLQLYHRSCGSKCKPVVVCSHCGNPVDARDVRYRDGPDAIQIAHVTTRKRTRRNSDAGVLERVRPCSVARTLQIIGERWSFLVIREFFYGVRRFDEFQARLGIATNILSDRLRRLVKQGIIRKTLYQSSPRRFEYRFTDKGRDLYGIMLVMMAWGDKWLSAGKPPMILRHKSCDHDFHAIVVCDTCEDELDPRQVSSTARYALPPEIAAIFEHHHPDQEAMLSPQETTDET